MSSNADRDRELQNLVGNLAGGLSGGLSNGGLPAGLGNLANLAQQSNSNGNTMEVQGGSQEPINIQSSAPQHEEAVQSESPNMNIGGLQDGGNYPEDAPHNEEPPHGEEQSEGSNGNQGNDYRRSGVPSQQHASFYEDEADEVDDVDESMERDTKSTIPHEDDDLIDNDIHERVHKDVIPRPEDFY